MSFLTLFAFHILMVNGHVLSFPQAQRVGNLLISCKPE